MIDIIKYALSFDFITNAYIPFMVNVFIILFASILVFILCAIFYEIFKHTIIEYIVAGIVVIVAGIDIFALSLCIIMMIGLPLLLMLISFRVYLMNIFPQIPFIIASVIGFIVSIILTTPLYQIIKSNTSKN